MRPIATSTSAEDAVVHRHAVRVYWEDTDAGGVVFYANYLKFFERARTEWLRTLGFSQEALRLQGCLFVVSETQLRYRLPARLDDALDITVVVQRAGSASLQIAQQAWRGSDLLAEGDIRIGCVDSSTLKPRRMPEPVVRALSDCPA